MGKWNYRRRWQPKRYYRDQRLPSPPTYYETEHKLRGSWKNVDLPWEERFCISVGIPWEKIVTTKKYMYCHDDIVKWNDTAGEETFHNSKKQFWAKINGIPSDVPEPDPDMYIDEIDWNPNIDSELVKDLDQAYFNPDESEKAENSDVTKQNDSFVPDAGTNDNPWECNSKVYNSDPWERGNDREIKEMAWGTCANKSIDGGCNQNSSWNTGVKWESGANNSWNLNRNTWASGGQTAGNLNETGWTSNRSGYGYGNNQRYTGSRGQNTWVSGGQNSENVNETGWRTGRNSQCDVHNGFSQRRGNGSGWNSNVSCRKREDPQQITASYKSARLRDEEYGNQWRRRRTHNRVSFAFE